MLASVPKDLDPKIVECIQTHGPMTINMFEQVARTYELSMPDFNESNTKFVTTTGMYGECVGGMFDRKSGKANGIIRKWRKDHLTEVFVSQNVGVGLRRQIDTHKLYFEYVIVDRSGKRLEKAQVLFRTSMPEMPHEVQML